MRLEEISILLVEDNPGDARLIREMCVDNDSGDRILIDAVTTLKDGLEYIQSDKYDALLLDLSLPDSFGMDTLLAMEAQAPNTAIVVLTGLDDEELGVQAVQHGAQDYLPKGDVDGKLLVRSIRYAIERHRAEMAVRRSEQEYRSLIDDVFDTSMVAVLILDSDFKVVWCNAATETYFGIPRERLLHKDKRILVDSELKCIFADPDDYATRLQTAYDAMNFTDRFECHVLPDSYREERWLEHWSQPIREGIFAGGRIEQYTDITDRKRLESAEQAQREFAEALRDIAALLTSTLNLDDVLGRILSNLGCIVPHDSAAITIIEDDHYRVARYRKSDNKRDTQEIVASAGLQSEFTPFLTEMYASRQPVMAADLQQDARTREAAQRIGIRSFVGAPILLQDQLIGFITLFSEEAGFFDADHAERLTAFAEQAAIAIQNARLYQQSQELAALEERQRLARELHDSVSQTLFTAQTMAESSVRRWERDPARARELMGEVHQLTSTALAEMRILLLELRPAALTEISLKQLFEQYLRPIQERRRFEIAMALDEIPSLPPKVQIGLYRITQEALNNIDKHAQARNVEVRAVDRPDRIELSIRDDGQGFEQDGTASTSLGLGIMRERAAGIGADIDIQSQIGTGTSITVNWPKNESEYA